MSRGNSTLTLQFCVNYGGQAEIADAAAAIARDVAAGTARPGEGQREDRSPGTSTTPRSPRWTCSCGPPGEQRISNFLLWQSAYAELVFLDTLWPDFDRRHLWYACELYAQRDRRFGGAHPEPGRPGHHRLSCHGAGS